MCSMIVNVHNFFYLFVYVEVKFRLKKCSNRSIMELVFQCAVHIVQSWSSSMCRLPFTAIAMLLQLLQLICPADNKLPRSVYVWKKFFQRRSSKYTKLRFCCHCNHQLGTGDKKCSGVDCQEVNQEPNTLIVLKPDKAIRQIFLRKYTKLVIAV